MNNKQALENLFNAEGFKITRSFLKHEWDKDEIKQACDDVVAEFMLSAFGEDWESDDQAMYFYTDTACDIRCDYEQSLAELHNAVKSNTRLDTLNPEAYQSEELRVYRITPHELFDVGMSQAYELDTNKGLINVDFYEDTSVGQRPDDGTRYKLRADSWEYSIENLALDREAEAVLLAQVERFCTENKELKQALADYYTLLENQGD